MQAFAFDCETHLIEPGLLAPKLVVASFHTQGEGGYLRYPDDAVADLLERLRSGWSVIGANIAYDFGVCLAHVASDLPLYKALRTEIFRAYDENRVWDVQIAEALYALAQGHMGKNPDTGETFSRYSLDIVVQLTTGRQNAKEHDEYRLRYGELDGIPIEKWPLSAQQYPIDDARNTFDAFAVQAARVQTGVETNLVDLSAQCRAAWALHLGAVWGFRVDQSRVNTYEREVTSLRNSQIVELTELGFFRPDGSKNTKVVARAVALAYAPKAPPCEKCQTTGFCGSEVILGKRGQPLKTKVVPCATCNGLGYLFDGFGLPRTPKGAVAANRDALQESGDENLLKLAKFEQTNKAIGTYIPYFREAGNLPLTLRPNVLLETGRASYTGVIQLLPRQGKERECIVARPGYVLYAVDFVGLELAAHAQSCLYLFGESKLADAINSGVKPHDRFAAQLMRESDTAFAALRAAGDKRAGAFREVAKLGNFGLMGGMGYVAFAQHAREKGPDTIGPDGTHYFGLRFCICLGYADKCGVKKMFEHNGRDIPPLCIECVRAAKDVRAAWLRQWPENEGYFDFVTDRVNRVGYIRQHHSNRIRGRIDFTSAANGYFQSLAADGAKRALYAVVKEQHCDESSVLYGSRNILFPHDELIGEIREDCASEGLACISEIMVREMRVVCPDVKVETEGALMRRWYKAAKRVQDANGRVIPWEPEEVAA